MKVHEAMQELKKLADARVVDMSIRPNGEFWIFVRGDERDGWQTTVADGSSKRFEVAVKQVKEDLARRKL